MTIVKRIQKIVHPVEGALWDGSEEVAQDIVRWVTDASGSATYFPKGTLDYDLDNAHLSINVGDGFIDVRPGYWLVQTSPGVFSTCTQKYFNENYDEIGPVA